MMRTRKNLYAGAALIVALAALHVASPARSAHAGGSLVYERWSSSAPGVNAQGYTLTLDAAPWVLRYWLLSGMDNEPFIPEAFRAQSVDIGLDVGWTTVYVGALSLTQTDTHWRRHDLFPLEGAIAGIRGTLARWDSISVTYDVALLATRLPGYAHIWGVRYELSPTSYVEAGARGLQFFLPNDGLIWDGWSLSAGVRW